VGKNFVGNVKGAKTKSVTVAGAHASLRKAEGKRERVNNGTISIDANNSGA